MYKNVFVLFFQGDQLRMRVKKICEGYAIYVCMQFVFVLLVAKSWALASVAV